MLLNIITANMMNVISLPHARHFLYFQINPGCGGSLRLVLSLCRQEEWNIDTDPSFISRKATATVTVLGDIMMGSCLL
jgi:hypothetical protein